MDRHPKNTFVTLVGKGPSYKRVSQHEHVVCALNGAANHYELPIWTVVNDRSAVGELLPNTLKYSGFIVCPEYLHRDTGGKFVIHWSELFDNYGYKVYTYNLPSTPKENPDIPSFGKISSVAETAVCMLNHYWNKTHFILNGIGSEPGYHPDFAGMAQTTNKDDGHFKRTFKQLKRRIEKLGCTYEML